MKHTVEKTAATANPPVCNHDHRHSRGKPTKRDTEEAGKKPRARTDGSIYGLPKRASWKLGDVFLTEIPLSSMRRIDVAVPFPTDRPVARNHVPTSTLCHLAWASPPHLTGRGDHRSQTHGPLVAGSIVSNGCPLPCAKRPLSSTATLLPSYPSFYVPVLPFPFGTLPRSVRLSPQLVHAPRFTAD